MKMTQNTVLITGGSSGIGYALAARFLKRGNTVLVTGRSEEKLADLRRRLPGAHTFVSDVGDPQAIRRLCADTTRAFPDINVLINNAGIGLKLDLNDTTRPIEDLDREIRSNLIGPIQMNSAFLPQLKAQKAGVIVNVTSGLAFVPMPLKPIYCATKAAMHSYTQSLRVQLRHTRVKVVELVPPAVKTDFNKGQASEEELNSPMLMNLDAFADAAMHGFEKGEDEVLPGMAPRLRLLGRLKPRAMLRTAEAEQMVAKGERARMGLA